MTTYKLPPAFYFDHIGRDLPGGTIIRQTKSHVFVDLGEDYAELLSDAEHYTAMGAGENGFGFEYAGLVRSAAATVKALKKQGPPAKCIDCGSLAEDGSPYCAECNAPIYISPRQAWQEVRES